MVEVGNAHSTAGAGLLLCAEMGGALLRRSAGTRGTDSAVGLLEADDEEVSHLLCELKATQKCRLGAHLRRLPCALGKVLCSVEG